MRISWCLLRQIDAAPLMKIAVTLAKNVLAPMATMKSVSAIDGAVQRKMHGKGVAKSSKKVNFSHFE